MSYKTIEYTVLDDKIMPNTLQSGGVAGDNNAVRVKFNLNNITLAADDKVRIEISNGVGGFNSSEHLIVADGCVYYDLPFDVTSAGGTAVLHLVICSCKDNIEQAVRYSYPAKIYFEESGCGSISYKQYKQGLSGLALECKSYADDAISAADEANQSATSAQSSQMAAQEAADEAKASADSAASEIAVHNVSDDAHSAKFSAINTQLSQMAPLVALSTAIETHNTDTAAHEDIREKIAMVQKYPCYEYATSGGSVQRFDDVSQFAHIISANVHGATDENGNSVVNPTLSVYGKNICPVAGWENKNKATLGTVIKGVKYTFSLTCIKSGTNTTTGFNLQIDGNSTGQYYSGDYGFAKITFTANRTGTLMLNGYNFFSASEVQLEVGSTATEYEPYTEPQTVTVPMTFSDGEECNIGVLNAVVPTMTVIASDDNNLISTVDVTYNRDIGKAIAALVVSQ